MQLHRVGFKQFTEEGRAFASTGINISALEVDDCAISAADFSALLSNPSILSFSRKGGYWCDQLYRAVNNMRGVERLSLSPTTTSITKIDWVNLPSLKKLELKRAHGFTSVSSRRLLDPLAQRPEGCLLKVSVVLTRDLAREPILESFHEILKNFEVNFVRIREKDRLVTSAPQNGGAYHQAYLTQMIEISHTQKS